MNKKPMLTALEQRAISALPADLPGALAVVRELHAEQGSFSEHLRIPDGLDQRFRLDPITCSDRTRSVIPTDPITGATSRRSSTNRLRSTLAGSWSTNVLRAQQRERLQTAVPKALMMYAAGEPHVHVLQEAMRQILGTHSTDYVLRTEGNETHFKTCEPLTSRGPGPTEREGCLLELP